MSFDSKHKASHALSCIQFLLSKPRNQSNQPVLTGLLLLLLLFELLGGLLGLFGDVKKDKILDKMPCLLSDDALLDDANAEVGTINILIRMVRHIIFLYLDMTLTPPKKIY